MCSINVEHMGQEPISLVIITLNEEKNIERCIKSVPFADEVVVLDSGSRDQTAILAQKLGAKVFVEEWRGYAQQKIRAASLAKNEWILSLDADEALSDDLQKEIISLLKNEMIFDAYKMPRLNHYMGRWMRHSGMYPDYQARLYHRARAKWRNVNVHEHIEAENIDVLASPILHWSFTSVRDQVDTINKYSALRALDFRSRGKKTSYFKMLIKPWFKFLELYFIKGGIFDGMPGLIACTMGAFATALRWAKLYELDYFEKAKKLTKGN